MSGDHRTDFAKPERPSERGTAGTPPYDDGLVVTFFVDEDRVRFEANRSWTVNEDGVVVPEGIRKPR